MNNFISLAFWFNSSPEQIGLAGQKALAAISAILAIILIIIIIKAYGQKLSLYRPSIDKLIPFCITNIIISIYIFFVNYQLIPILRSRAWYIVWFLVVIFWLSYIIKDFYKRASRREQIAKEAEMKKYLP